MLIEAGKSAARKIDSWYFANVLAAMVMLIAGAVYVANTWSPSSYGYVLVNVLGDRQSGPDWGKSRAVRSDEWGVVTPLTQATINNGFERINRTSFYGEDLRINYGLPIHDWGIVFKPTMWLYGVVNPAYAYSVHWFLLAALFIFGHAWLLRWFGAGPVLGFALAAGLYFTGFVQFWWNEKGPIFALFPWVILPFSTRLGLGWKVAIMYWVAVAWFLTNFYPPIQISLAFVGFILLLAREPTLFKPASLALMLGGAALAAGTAAIYLWDYLQATTTTLYPGSRIVSGGIGFGLLQLRNWLSWFLPAINFDASYESLVGFNICEIGTVGLAYSLLMLCFIDISRWHRIKENPAQRRVIITLGAGLALMLCWIVLPLPSWLGAPLLWNHVQPLRMQYAAGILLALLVFVSGNYLGLRITPARIAIFCGIILLDWFAWSLPDASHQGSLFIAAIGLPAILWAWRQPNQAHTGFAVASLLAGIILFGKFNPLQSAWPIFNHAPNAWTKMMDQLAAHNDGVLAVTEAPSAVANGLGYRSVGHVTAVPQLKFWRNSFPELPQAEFDGIFNRYAHIYPTSEDKPRLLQTDVVYVPVDHFRKIAPVRLAPAPTQKIELSGHIDVAAVEGDDLVIKGWGPWTGPLDAHEIEVTLPHAPNGTPKRTLMFRPDLPPVAAAVNGFSLHIPLAIAGQLPAVCVVAHDTSTGRRTLLHNPSNLAYCTTTDSSK